MKPRFNFLIKNILCVISFAAAGLMSSVNADVTVQQFASWADGNAGGPLSPTVAFDIVNTNSILIATVYVDTATPALTDVRFGNGGGIGSGDVAPTLTFADNRLLSYVFINPSTASGLSFRATNSTGSGAAAALYEISGANTDTSSITTATNSTTITTTTASELVVSFAGRNGGNQSLGTPTIFTVTDIAVAASTVRGTGTVASASATAPTIGSQNITWTVNTGGSASAGRIAYAFEAAPVVTDPYLVWAGAGVPFDSDANGDGVSNGLAWLLGAANKDVNALSLLPTVTETGGGLVTAFKCLNDAGNGNSTLFIQHSRDLGIGDPWTTVAVPETSDGPTSGVVFDITPGSPRNTVTATIQSSEAGGTGKLFSRLKVTGP